MTSKTITPEECPWCRVVPDVEASEHEADCGNPRRITVMIECTEPKCPVRPICSFAYSSGSKKEAIERTVKAWNSYTPAG